LPVTFKTLDSPVLRVVSVTAGALVGRPTPPLLRAVVTTFLALVGPTRAELTIGVVSRVAIAAFALVILR